VWHGFCQPSYSYTKSKIPTWNTILIIWCYTDRWIIYIYINWWNLIVISWVSFWHLRTFSASKDGVVLPKEPAEFAAPAPPAHGPTFKGEERISALSTPSRGVSHSSAGRRRWCQVGGWTSLDNMDEDFWEIRC
jgi:hypothetical protein